MSSTTKAIGPDITLGTGGKVKGSAAGAATGELVEFDQLNTALGAKAPTSRALTAGTGLTGGGDLSADRTFSCSFGSGAGSVCQGNDARLSDARTPTAHATTHKSGGSDPIKLNELAAPTASVPFGSQKATGLLSGAAAGEAVEFSQIADLIAYLNQDPARCIDVAVDDFEEGSAATGAVIIVNGSVFGRVGFRAGSSGGAAVTCVTTGQDALHIGVIEPSRGTTAANISSIAIQPAGTLNPVQLGSGQNWIQDWIIRIPTASDGTNTVAIRVGFGDASGALPTNGLYAEYTNNTGTPTNWKPTTMVASSPTLLSGGTNVPVPIGAWTHVRIVWDGTTATMFADGVLLGSTTTVPTGVNMCEFAHVVGSAGTSNRTLLIDRFSRLRKFTARAA